jgi:hypothetical protein
MIALNEGMGQSATYRHVQGMGDLSAALLALPEDMRNTTLKQGVWRAVQPIKVAAKRFAKRSEDTGALRESITEKVVNYPQSGKCVGLVGPDNDFYWRGSKAKPLAALYGNARRPAKYAHLVEYGHLIAKGGSLKPQYNLVLTPTGAFSKNGKPLKRWKRGTIKAPAKGTASGFVRAKPFIRPAVITTQAEQSEQFFIGIKMGYERAVAREVRTGRHVRMAA